MYLCSTMSQIYREKNPSEKYFKMAESKWTPLYTNGGEK